MMIVPAITPETAGKAQAIAASHDNLTAGIHRGDCDYWVGRKGQRRRLRP